MALDPAGRVYFLQVTPTGGQYLWGPTGKVAANVASFSVGADGSVSYAMNPATLPGEVAGAGYAANLQPAEAVPTSYALASGSLPSGFALSSAGVLSGTATVAGTYTFTVRTTSPAATGTRTLTLVVSPAAPASVTISTSVTSTVAGNAFAVSVRVYDKFGNGWTGSVSLASSDGQAVTPGVVAVNQGVGSASVTLTAARAISIRASAGGVSATTGTITVSPAAAAVYISTLQSVNSGGTTFAVTILVKDRYGNPYTGTVALNAAGSNGGVLSLPATVTLGSNGTATFTATAIHSGSVRIAASLGGVGTNATVTINPTAYSYAVTMTAYGYWVVNGHVREIVYATYNYSFTASDQASALSHINLVEAAWTQELNNNEEPNGRWTLYVPYYDERDQDRVIAAYSTMPAN